MISLILSSGKLILEIEKDENNKLDLKALKEKLLEINIVNFSFAYNTEIIYYSFLEKFYYTFTDVDDIIITVILHEMKLVNLITSIYTFLNIKTDVYYRISLYQLKLYYGVNYNFNNLMENHFQLMYILYYCPEFVTLLSNELLNDDSLIFNIVIKINNYIILYLSTTNIVFQNKNSIIKIIKNIDDVYIEYLIDKIRNTNFISDNEILYTLVKKNSFSIKYISIETLNKDLIIEAVKQNGNSLEILIYKFRSCCSFSWLIHNFLDNSDKKSDCNIPFLLDYNLNEWDDNGVPIKTYLEFFMYDKNDYCKLIDIDVIKIAIRNSPEVIKFVPHVYFTEEFLMELFRLNKYALKLIPEKIKDNFLIKYFDEKS